MITKAPPLPYQGQMAGLRRFTVAEYHRLIELGFLTEDDNLELLEGYLVYKMARNPPHDPAIQKGTKLWLRLMPLGWDVRGQSAITLIDSEPEPGFAIVRGDENSYLSRHPLPADIGLAVEVSDSTLPGDCDDKGRIYAASRINCYWIVNLINRHVEVYTSPSGPGASASYASRTDYHPGDTVPLTLPGVATIHVAVQDLLP